MNPSATLDPGDIFRVDEPEKKRFGLLVKNNGISVDLDLLVAGGVMRTNVAKSRIVRIANIFRINDDRASYLKTFDQLEAAKNLIERMMTEIDQNFVDHHLTIEAESFIKQLEQ